MSKGGRSARAITSTRIWRPSGWTNSRSFEDKGSPRPIIVTPAKAGAKGLGHGRGTSWMPAFRGHDGGEVGAEGGVVPVHHKTATAGDTDVGRSRCPRLLADAPHSRRHLCGAARLGRRHV